MGPHRLAVEAHGPEGRKMGGVLLAVADFLDAGRDDPTITELTRRSPVNRASTAQILDRLERDGHLAIERGDRNRGEHSRYRLLLPVGPPSAPHHQTKGTTVPSTKSTTEPREGLLAAQRRHSAFRHDFLRELQVAEWPLYRDLRDSHNQAVDALLAAEETGDEDVEAEALQNLLEAAGDIIAVLPEDLAAAEVAISAAEEKIGPKSFGSSFEIGGLSRTEAESVDARAAAKQAEYQQEIRRLIPLVRRDIEEALGVFRVKGRLQAAGAELVRVRAALRVWKAERA